MIPSADYIRILPEVILSIFGVVVMLIEATLDDRNDRRSLGAIAFVGVLASIAATVFQYHYRDSAFSGVVRADGFSIFFHFVVGIVSLLVILGSIEYLAVQGIRAGEYYGLILFGTVGMMLMSSAVELVLVFISLEISSISTYILAGFRRRTATSIEASLKYFLLGSFATAFFLYGVAMMFGATSIKRMLAYSSIAHAGYLLVAFAANPDLGISAAMFYTASYAVMNAGAFLVISHFGSLRERYVTLEDYAGLGRRQPLLAATLTIFMLSLIGIPITGGFLAKFYVFTAALKANLVGLVILGVINSAIAAYYYLRVIVYMYMREPLESAE